MTIDRTFNRRYVMLVDTLRCINCRACVVACRAEWQTPLGYSRNWVREVEGTDDDGRPWVQLFSGRCQHCDDPACVDACPAGAAWKREDGIVLVDEALCSGCELCVPACPYEARWLNPQTRTISKCTFCQPRVDEGLVPACVQTCVGGALHFGDANDPGSEVSRLMGEKAWVQLTTPEVPGGTSLYYHTGGRPLPREVLPRPVGRQVQSTILAEAVNPAAKAGIGGMLAFFAVAGLKKVIDRLEVHRDREEHDE
jgi:tetrathionate reductase subunit B